MGRKILRELPTRQGKRSDLTSSPMGNEVTKSDALKDAGFTPKTAAQLEQLAANPEVVQAVLKGVWVAPFTEEPPKMPSNEVQYKINAT